MIEFRVAARDRKTVIVGGIVVLSLFLIGRGGPAWYRWRGNAEASTRVARVEASKATASVNRAPEVSKAIRHAELQRMEVLPAFVNGSGIAAAAATLASLVGDAATTNGVRMGALQASGDSAAEKSGGVARVRVRGNATGDVTAVTRFLAALEGGVPFIAVRELTVTQGEPNASVDQPESLHIEFVIEALAHLASTEEGQ